MWNRKSAMQISYTKPFVKISARPHINDVICLTMMAEKSIIVYINCMVQYWQWMVDFMQPQCEPWHLYTFSLLMILWTNTISCGFKQVKPYGKKWNKHRPKTNFMYQLCLDIICIRIAFKHGVLIGTTCIHMVEHVLWVPLGEWIRALVVHRVNPCLTSNEDVIKSVLLSNALYKE